MNKFRYVIVSFAVLIAGCSSMPFSSGDKMVDIKKNNGTQVPEWFLVKDADDQKFITVTATDVSKDMQFSIDKATLNAKIQIAERLKTDVDSLFRETTSETGNGVKEVEREIDRVSKVRVTQSIGFFKRENVAVFKEGDNYRAYVKFRISIDDARRLTAKDNSKNREERLKELN